MDLEEAEEDGFADEVGDGFAQFTGVLVEAGGGAGRGMGVQSQQSLQEGRGFARL